MTKIHYVYRITNIIKSKHYYGVRSTKNLPINDLGIKYFSSSNDKEFIKDQKENPQNFKYKIIRIYDDRKEAITLEIKLHSKFNVGVSGSFYNLSKQTDIGFDRSGMNFTHTDETKLKIGLKHKGKNVSINTRKKLSDIHKGKQISQEHRLQISKKLKGSVFSNEHKEKISNSLLNKPKSDDHKQNLSAAWVQRKFVKCPNCGKESQNIGMMNRWHFENCKFISLDS